MADLQGLIGELARFFAAIATLRDGWLWPLSKTSATFQSQDQSYFFRLPAGLRNEIYRLSLVDPIRGRLDLGSVVQPPLTATCRRIAAEALPIFFAENKFSLDLDTRMGAPPQPHISTRTRWWVGEARELADHITDLEIKNLWHPRYCGQFVLGIKPDKNGMTEVTISTYRRRDALATAVWDYLARKQKLDLQAKGLGMADVLALFELVKRNKRCRY